MKSILLAISLLSASFIFGQKVQVRTLQLENGQSYPEIFGSGYPEVEAKMNDVIHHLVDSLKNAEFCIGDFGYVYKSPYLQIHLFHNCDYQWDNTHVYYNFWTPTGASFNPISMFIPEKKDKLNKEIFNRLAQNKTSSCHGFSEDDNLVEMATIIFHQNGLQFELKEKEGCPAASAILSWTDLMEYMKDSHEYMNEGKSIDQ